MLREDHVRKREEWIVRGRGFLREGVDAGAGDLPIAQRQVERLLVDQLAAGAIDDDRLALHETERPRTNHMARRRIRGGMDRDDVSPLQQLVETAIAELEDLLLVRCQADR